jgi:hypothetical protein
MLKLCEYMPTLVLTTPFRSMNEEYLGLTFISSDLSIIGVLLRRIKCSNQSTD